MWHPPGYAEATGVNIAAGSSETAPIVSAVGNWANYTVWADVPNSWLETEFVLRVRTSQLVTELDRRRIADIDHMVATPPGLGGGIVSRPGIPDTVRLSGQLFAAMGRPGLGQLEITAVQRAGVELSGGKFYARLWGTEGTAQGDRAGRPIVDRWAGRPQFVSFADDELAADGVPAPFLGGFAGGGFGPFGVARAVHLTDITLTGTTGLPVLVTLQQREPASGTVVVHAQFRVSLFGGVNLNLAMPMTGQRGWNWEITREAAIANFVSATIGGFVA